MTARAAPPEPPEPPDRPAAVCVMEPAAAALVLPDDVRARLSTLVRLDPAPPGTDLPAALAEAEILVSGWGCPRLTAEVLAVAPRLRAVMHAAGTVRPLVSEALWERGIVVSSAADANAGPVASCTVALITLAARRTLTMAAGYADGWPDFADRTGADGLTVAIVGRPRWPTRTRSCPRTSSTRAWRPRCPRHRTASPRATSTSRPIPPRRSRTARPPRAPTSTS
ncbi:hypothetical protein [Streptomyces niveus]|uniref:hypothetical protein n=1 Tax=Streptomyces niveus TaxID=193462 RepID=UPI00386C7871